MRGFSKPDAMLPGTFGNEGWKANVAACFASTNKAACLRLKAKAQ
jgi:hypothetical protein